MRYRLSFWFAIGVALLTASISIAWTLTHLLLLVLDLAAIGLLRSLAHWEVVGLRASWATFCADRAERRRIRYLNARGSGAVARSDKDGR